MIIEYVHKSNPNRVKTCDTQKSLMNSPPFGAIPLEEWNRQELERMERDKQKGLILRYEIKKN